MPDLEPVLGNPFDYNESPIGPTAATLEPLTSKRLKGPAADLEPVAGNPFDQAQPEADLSPVAGNPFGGGSAAPASQGGDSALTPSQPPPTKDEVTFGDRLLQGFDQMQALSYGGVEAIGAALPSSIGEPIRAFGAEGRARNEAEAKAVPPAQSIVPGFQKAQGIQDYIDWAKTLPTWARDVVAGQLPQMGVTAGGALLGGAAGFAVGGPPGATIGAMAGASGPSFLMGTGEVQQALKEKAPNVEAPGWVLGGGAAIAALDSVVPGRLGSALIRRFGREAAESIASRAIVKEAAKDASIEGVTEALQEAIQEVSAAGGADQTPDWPNLPARAVEAGAAGALMGGLAGGVGGAFHSGQEAQPTGEPQPPSSASPPSGAVPSAPSGAPGGEAQSLEGPRPNWYYSQVRQVAEDKLPERGSPEQMIATLTNSPGVKMEELGQLGILDWLKAQKGSVSKADVIAEIEANALNVETIETKSGGAALQWEQPNDRTWIATGTPYRILRQNVMSREQYGRSRPAFQVVKTEEEGYQHAPADDFDTLEAAQGWIAREVTGNEGTQYDEYVLPLGRNYKEVKLTLPENIKEVLPKDWTIERTPDRQFTIFNEEGQMVSSGDTREIAFQGARLSLPEDMQRANPELFMSQHFTEPNILAHARTTDRTTSDGENALHAEEVQSDWHQQGREQGYIINAPVTVQKVDGLWTGFQNGRRIGASLVSDEAEALQAMRRLANSRNRERVPDAPFKTNWGELVMKKLLSMAVEGGYDRLTWSPGHVHSTRWRQTGADAAGQHEFYDKILPRYAEKWAKKLGSRVEKVNIPAVKNANGDFIVNEGGFENATMPVWSVPITPQMRSALSKQGFPLFSLAELGNGVYHEGNVPFDASMVNVAKQAFLAVKALAKRMGVRNNISLVFRQIQTPQGPGLGQVRWFLDEDGDRQYLIEIDPSRHEGPLNIMATLAHEFGHITMWEHWDNASPSEKLKIELAYSQWKETNKVEGMAERLRTRDNFILAMQRAGNRDFRTTKFSQLSAAQREYWMHFDEWFAEQVARWITTDERPLSVVDKFFAAIGKQIRKIYELFQKKFGMTATPHQFVSDWLNSLLSETNVQSLEVMQELERQTKRENKLAMKAIGANNFPVTGRTLASESARQLLAGANAGDDASREGKASAAAADRYSTFYKWMVSMVQLAARNPHIAPLQRYRELWQMKQAERTTMLDAAQTVLKSWRDLTGEQQTNVSKVIDDYMNMVYLSEDEILNKVVRRPTDQEMAALFAKHKVSPKGQTVFKAITDSFDGMLDKYGQILVQDAMGKISDPVKQAQALQGIGETLNTLRNQPYFPAMHFGDYTITIRHAGGGVVHFETFESKRRRDAAARELKSKVPAGGTMQVGVLPLDVKPFLGMPSRVLDLMAEKLALSDTQREALDYLRFENSPAHTFKHRLTHKPLTPGYASDFVRAYANYFFHASNYFSNLKYVDALRAQIKAVEEEAKALPDGTKRGQIARFMHDHLQYGLDPKPDFAFLRGLAFLWFLGFSPAAATLNLSQIVVGSYPFLGSKFGDLKTIGALSRAGATLSTYYRRGSLENLGVTDRDLRGLSEGVKEGVITEAMAPELAAISEGRTLGKGFGGNAAQRVWTNFMEASSLMFEMTEQVNRRITFRAAWDMASNDPSNKYVQEMKEKHKLQYERLREAGWNDIDAGAFVVAKDAVETTQYVYQQYAQPRFMRGRLRTLFVFKTFVQNTLFMLWNYPTTALRSLLIMGFLGGLMGLPGADDLRGLLKALAWKLFGRDFDLEEEARKAVQDLLGKEVPPDVLLHGMARRGFGLPTVLDSLGVPLGLTKDWGTVWRKFQMGRSPQDAATLGPNFFDRSKSIGLGHILPVDVGALFGPTAAKDANRAIADSAQRASGAVFGTFFNIYKAMEDAQTSAQGFKVWERAFPRFAASASRGMRAYFEGGERDGRGNVVIKYDVTDPRQMMEVIGLSLGYQPLRLSAQWDRRMAEMEAITYWNIRRQGLLNQLWASRGDREQYDRVIEGVKAFNALVRDTPASGKAITSDVIQRSFRTRATTQNARESGVPRVRADIPIAQEIQRLYPEAEVDVRRVK